MNCLKSAISVLRGASSAAALCAASLASAAYAQAVSPAPAGGAVDAGDARTSSTDIIVTATRRAERLQDVPISIASVSSDQLEAQNVVDLQGVTGVTPAFRYQEGRSPSFSLFSIRGITTFSAAPGVDNAVGISVDGVPLARVTATPGNLIDVSRVEILRGPQGTLFGKNASAGVVNIITNGVDLDRDSFSGRLYYGSYDEVQADAAVNLALAPSFGIRLAGWNIQHDGFIDNLYDGSKVGGVKNQGLRFKARMQPAPELDINISGEVSKSVTDGPIATLRRVIEGSVYNDRDVARGIDPGPKNRTGYDGGVPNGFTLKNKSVTAQVDWSPSDYTFTMVTGYRRTNDASTYDPISVGGQIGPINYDLLTNRQFTDYDQFSTELRLVSPQAARLRYVVGVFYSDLDLTNRVEQIIPAGLALPALLGSPTRDTNMHMNVKSYSIFGSGTFEVTDRFRVTAGGRYNWDRVKGTFDRDFLTPPPPTVPRIGPLAPGGSLAPYSAERGIKADKGTVTLGAQYDFAKDMMAYATFSTGYHGPGLAFNIDSTDATLDPAVGNGVVRPETSTMYEAGVKTQWFDRRLTLNFAVYRETFKNFQTEARVFAGVLPVFATINANELRSTGAEFEYVAQLSDELSISGFVAYNDAKFIDFENGPCFIGQTAAEGCMGIPPNTFQDLSGKRLGLAPKWTHGATAQFDTELAPDLVGSVNAGYNYVGRQAFENTGDPFKVQKDYAVVNLSVGIGAADKKWTLTFYANNIFKKNYVGAITTRDLVGGRTYVNYPVYGALRRLGAALAVKF